MQRLTISRLANLRANAIFNGFDNYQIQFKEITRRARSRFESRDWHGAQADAHQRLDLYKDIVDRVLTEIRELLEDRVSDKLIWTSMKAVYSGLITERDDWELAETFFNSITRRIFTTVGVDPDMEFVDTDFETPPTQSRQTVYRTFSGSSSTEELIKTILNEYQFQSSYADLERDAQLAAAEIEAHLRQKGALRIVERTRMLKSVFYRGNGAYLVGRMFSGSHEFPIVLALLNTPQGLVIDAVLLDEDDVSILFSFTRSYFHLDVERNYDLVRFLKTIMPRKRIAELYISIGHNKHGKTELYRDLLHYLAQSDDQFEIAPGKRGMVMTVFTIPGYDLVFKVIKDQFSYPKKVTRQAVMSKYHLVFNHDRAGRLVDAQEFEYLKFEKKRFSEELLQELQKVASQSVKVEEDHVIIKHAYVERRVFPLDLYVEETEKEAAEKAVIDYGNAIKDMAATNIFPGDMMLKNFGVTRHGRVIFYDYDELALLTECNFRRLPPARTYEEELSAEPMFVVDDNDLFPEEFANFLGLTGELFQIFSRQHSDLLEIHYWRQMQERLRNGEIIHIFPYDQ
ncbi:bifunctional isocitrate dehydrogenase kinase/phosphatase, partial [Candidatus Saccharibacteria bacterium]|nr:bifunctional isocitrate dehydrogenase kinase/phosphatase [candidate division KSB1 bacterium]NIS24396.1 bifunctional isocitrate dehydrogenase kinase/phosphatase [candidate division KSB1 bacterium]NIW00299.1 bifunctional isocitrate dehydrogenase kinase/phosphatase [Candidatus Saccharibacteria bacterium]NIW69431.1 bifunctional isocitrate dehydrogenase kinase/phosphatase [candidate division KSB1 bacterium]